MFDRWKIRFRALKWFINAYRSPGITFSYSPTMFSTWEKDTESLLTKENISRLKYNTDEQSCKVLNLFLDELKFFLKLQRYNHAIVKDLLHDEDKREREKFRLEAEKYKKSGIPEPLPPESLYFHHGLRFAHEAVKKYVEHKIFIDGGSCAGDSTLVFQMYHPRKVLAFDISPKTASLFHKVMKRMNVPKEKYLQIQKGLGEKYEELYFNDKGDCSVSLSCSGSTKAEIIPLDECVEINSCVGLIKLDLEGFGLQAVRGMINTIKRDRPILSFAVYHCFSELFGIKTLLDDLDLKYKIEYKSCYFDGVGELIIFAYPEELLEC